ncbi:hypothetical protein ACSBR1_012442 [Camellia fascicularis]
MDGAIPEAALRQSQAHLERRWAWRAFVKSAEMIYEVLMALQAAALLPSAFAIPKEESLVFLERNLLFLEFHSLIMSKLNPALLH